MLSNPFWMKKKKKNPINVLTLLSKYALVGWRILCRVNSGPEVRQQRVFFYSAALKTMLKLKRFI